MTTKTTKKADVQEFAKAGVEQIEAAVKTNQENAEKAFKAGKENADKAYKAGADVLTENVEKFYSTTKEQWVKVLPTMGPKLDEMADWTKGNLDAFLTASEIAKKGAETIANEMAALNQAAMSDAAAAAKDLMAVKSYPEFVEMQTEKVRGAFDKMVAETTKISEMSATLATEISEPLQARWAKFGESFRPSA